MTKIEDLGWNDFFEAGRANLDAEGFSVARVVAEHRGAYEVRSVEGEYLAKVTGKQMFLATSREDYPAVGDWVMIEKVGGSQAVIRSILPRKTIIKRKYGDKNRTGEKNQTQVIATNIDSAFIIESVNRDYNLNRLERYLAIVKDSGIEPMIILNKADLISPEELEEKLSQIRERLGSIKVIATSALTDEGLAELKKNILANKTYCFLGSSGVGKSTLINKLIGGEVAKTENISASADRGRHVTTGREMYFLGSGGIVIDNPGIREVGMTDVGSGVDNLFDEMSELAKNCKYSDCTHTTEPGCAILEAFQNGQLDEERYQNYISLKKETEYYEMSETEKRNKDRQFGKFMKNAKKDLKKFKNKDY